MDDEFAEAFEIYCKQINYWSSNRFKLEDQVECLYVKDFDFALEDGLRTSQLSKGTIAIQFHVLEGKAGLNVKLIKSIFDTMLSNSEKVKRWSIPHS